MRLNEEVALSSNDVIQENQGSRIVYEFSSKGGKDQGTMMKYS
jgi:hypothetical protein